jgi:probable HAF family extracellular repeat protein
MLLMKSCKLVRLGFVFCVTLAASFCLAQTYKMTDLGTPQGDGFAVPRGVNASAQVTGSAGPGGDSGTSDVFLYSKGTFTDFGTLGGKTGIGNGINASSQVAGYSTDAAGTYRAFISSGDSLVDIGDLGGGSAVAYAINDAGQVVGSAVMKDGSNHPFLYSNGKMIDLGTLGSPKGSSWWNSAEGINNSGVVVGYSYTNQSQAPFRGFIWSKGKMKEIGTLGGSLSQAYAVNNLGQVTGIAYLADGSAHAFIREVSGKMRDLGALERYGATWGFGINDAGVVVGQAQLNANVHAFVYNGKRIQDLNKLVGKRSGWTLIVANGVNNAGQIVCTGENSAGIQHAFLLTPQ